MATREEIAEAINDKEWQEFRKGLKGKSTADKLRALRKYYWRSDSLEEDEKVDIRIDNYLKALARGGQIEPVDTSVRDYVNALLHRKIIIRK